MGDIACFRCGQGRRDHGPNSEPFNMCPGYIAGDKTMDPARDPEVHDDLVVVELLNASKSAARLIEQLRDEAARAAPVDVKPNGAKLTNVVTWEGQEPLGPSDQDDPPVFSYYVAQCAMCGYAPELVFSPGGKVILRCENCGVLILDPRHLPKT